GPSSDRGQAPARGARATDVPRRRQPGRPGACREPAGAVGFSSRVLTSRWRRGCAPSPHAGRPSTRGRESKLPPICLSQRFKESTSENRQVDGVHRNREHHCKQGHHDRDKSYEVFLIFKPGHTTSEHAGDLEFPSFFTCKSSTRASLPGLTSPILITKICL